MNLTAPTFRQAPSPCPRRDLAAALLVLCCALAPALAAVQEVPLANPDFEEGVQPNGLPVGWGLYAGVDQKRKIQVVAGGYQSAHALLIFDDDPTAETGVTQTVPLKAGETYQISVMVRGVAGATSAGSYLQFRFLPSNDFVQASLVAVSPEVWHEVSLKATAPPGTTSAVIYLYTHRDPTPKVLVDHVKLLSGVEPPPPPPPPAPNPYPLPQVTHLKDLHLLTALVEDGRPGATIVVPASGRYDALAARIQAAVQQITGVKVAVERDDSPAGAVPIQGNLIALGNRSTNQTISRLYDLYYCLLDLKYPGPGGYNVRSLHSPFGDGRNVIFVGASDDGGMAAATDDFVGRLNAARGGAGHLSVGWLMDIKLGAGLQPPTDIHQFETWEASRMYGSSGYFGWNMISKHMAMYYMTGNEAEAREALRLAFPDQKAKDEIAALDGEMIEDKDDPLAGTYHYNSHMMILYWNLIEASPAFSDEVRLKVTNAFARQLKHRLDYDGAMYYRTTSPGAVGSRHEQYGALSLYCLGRYFSRYDPSPIWDQCVRASLTEFASLQEHAWVGGENDNLFWYNTGTAPILSYMVLTGDRKPLENGALGRLLRAQEALISGLPEDWALNGAALDYLNKAAYLTGDGRWITYRERTGLDTNLFRLGQSFWPDERIRPAQPTDLVGTWNVSYLTTPAWEARATGFAPEESFYFGSFRSAPGASGDFILAKGFNGGSRNPYHSFALLELRLAGNTLLKGFRNQVLTRVDGMVEPQVAMDAALKHCDVLGETAALVAEVPKAAFCTWRRSLAQRVGQYALVVDDLAFREASDNVEVQSLWETTGGVWDKAHNALRIAPTSSAPVPKGWVGFRALEAQCVTGPQGNEDLIRLDSLGIVLLRARQPGLWLEMPFTLAAKVTGEVYADLLAYTDRGILRISLDGQVMVPELDHTSTAASPQRVSLGRLELAAGTHRLRLEVIKPRDGGGKCYAGLTGVVIRPEGVAEVELPPQFAILPSELVAAHDGGGYTTLQWQGAVGRGEHRRFFTLIGMQSGGPHLDLACLQVAPNAAALKLPGLALAVVGEYAGMKGDQVAPNAAALKLPGSALAVVGEYAGVKGDLVVMGADHLYGQGVEVTPVLRADQPVDVDWSFSSGALAIAARQETKLTLPADAGGDRVITVGPGDHTLRGMAPSGSAMEKAGEACRAALAAAEDIRANALKQRDAGAQPVAAPPLTEVFDAQVGGSAADLLVVPSAGGPMVCVAEGKRVHLLGPDGKETRLLQADGDIRLLHWWPESRLLLAGCVDEKVIAFDEAGSRKWVFTSVMDPAVFKAAKQYWFKSAPGHEGIHGLYSGAFDGGKSRCFVGSACTLEILDDAGQLVKRLPIFWGPGHKFALMDAGDGSRNLLIAREPTDSEQLAVVNSKTLAEIGRNFFTVPEGHTYVGGWAQMSRDHIFVTDLEGDGKREVVSEINGVWNRVTVWAQDGTALYSATFGPGDVIPARNIRGLDLADLAGDSKLQIVVATSSGFVVALDRHCGKLWARRLDSPPTALKCLPAERGLPARIVVGCENGAVWALDGMGKPVGSGSVKGAPTQMEALAAGPTGRAVVLATDRGEVKAFSF